jgi:hypothetical protein
VLEFVPFGEVFDLLADMGNAVQYDESNGNFFVLLRGGLIDSCTELAQYVLTHRPLPQNLRQSPGAGLQQSGNWRASVNSAALATRARSLFKAVPKSHLKSLSKLPFLRQRFGHAVAQFGSEAALSQKYRTTWSKGTQRA